MAPRTQLSGSVVVVSPHCDDAVLSLGATLAAHTGAGGSATVLTVLAGDPSSTASPGPWDRASGFGTAGEAARARRSEDVRACRRVGARAVHLPGVDEQYAGPPPSPAALAPHLVADELLLPGWPLRHRDHLAVTRLVLAAVPADRPVRLYVEQPYALRERGRTTPAAPWQAGPVFERSPASPGAAARKAAAVLAYRSQLRQLVRDGPPHRVPGDGGWRLALDLLRAALRGGERVSAPVAAGRLVPAG